MPNRGTKADLLFRQLTSDILNGRLVPGQRLGHTELCRRYNVGVGVLREVLPRLVERGLATTESQLGFRVISLSVGHLRELTEARTTIETLVFRRSVEAGDIAWEASVVAANHELIRTERWTADGLISADWLENHMRFHRTLLQGCPNKQLVRIAENLREVAEVYQCWALWYQPSRLNARDINAEHAAITEKAVNRDADAAVTALSDHIMLTTDLLIEGWSEHNGSPSAAAGGPLTSVKAV
jgi:DNA-binding GntR family transcriptional regulator